MIKTFIPYNTDKNLVEEYNECMSLLNYGDWAIFLDHDAMFTTYDWYKSIEKYIQQYGDYSCFVATTNRIGGTRMKDNKAPKQDDIIFHRLYGQQVSDTPYEDELEDFTVPTPHHLSGVCFALSYDAWKKIGGFKAWSEKSNILGVDSALHKNLRENGLKVGIMKKLYVYHWYCGGGSRTTKHLK